VIAHSVNLTAYINISRLILQVVEVAMIYPDCCGVSKEFYRPVVVQNGYRASIDCDGANAIRFSEN
jgi:hypothetical protein